MLTGRVGVEHLVAVYRQCAECARDAGGHQQRPPRADRALQHAVDSGRGAEVHGEGVLRALPTIGDDRQPGADHLEFAQGATDLVDHVSALRAEPAAATTRVGPPAGRLAALGGEQRQMHEEGGEPRGADRPVADLPGKQRLWARVAELGADHVHDVGLLGGGQHRPSLGQVCRERLLAHHMQPSLGRLDCQRGMGVWRRRDGDCVDVRDREGLVEGGCGVRYPHALGAVHSAISIAADERADLEPGIPERRYVGDAAEAGPDHGQPKCLVRHAFPA
nr:hypothetical protein [Rhodococcus sp. MTM3W5.2]